jgi:hypothetical protein
MLKDSNQLAALKGKLAHDANQRAKEAAPADQSHAPVMVQPKGSDKDAKPGGKSAHSAKQAPGEPESDLEDVRRLTRVI